MDEGVTIFICGGDVHCAHRGRLRPIRRLNGRDDSAQRVALSPMLAAMTSSVLASLEQLCLLARHRGGP